MGKVLKFFRLKKPGIQITCILLQFQRKNQSLKLFKGESTNNWCPIFFSHQSKSHRPYCPFQSIISCSMFSMTQFSIHFCHEFQWFCIFCMSNCCFSEANSSLIGLTRAVNSKTRKVTSAGSPTKRTVRCSRALPSVGRRSWVLRPEGTPTTWTFPPRLLIDFPCFVFGSLPLIVFYGWITVNLNCWRIFLDVHFPASL